ncbi:MAG: acyltransferase [Alphaproteobacteria bacterium]|nr:acyltransferase [Alphaproteobacteria bacterium]
MRKIALSQIIVFSVFYITAISAAVFSTWLTFGALPMGDFRGIVLFLGGIVFFFVYLILIYRIFMVFFPLEAGNVPPGSKQEFIYHVYVLFFLLGFYSVLKSGFIPIPLLRAFYMALGAKLGKNTYSAGMIYDPLFIKIGHDCLLGHGSVLTPHAIENERLSHFPIEIGDHVTLGVGSIVLQGVKIRNNAIVSAGAVVLKNTVIGENEIWGGIPARLIKKNDPM